jgi:hypothetical protein
LQRNKKNININTIIKGVDHLYFSGFLSLERFFLQAMPAEYSKNKKIINIKDLHFFRELRYEMLTGINLGNHKKIMLRELDAYRCCDLVLSFSNDEIRLVNKIDNRINIKKHFYFNPDFNSFVKSKFKYNNKLIFIGNFLHQPNLDGILYFDKNFTFDSSTYQFEIYGEHSIEKLKDIKLTNNYKIMGQVKNSNQCYSQGGLFISPLRFGGGIKIKIIEAALSCLPIIATSESVEGLDLEPNNSYFTLSNDTDFSEILKKFKNRDAALKEVAINGYKRINKQSNEKKVKDNLKNLIYLINS